LTDAACRYAGRKPKCGSSPDQASLRIGADKNNSNNPIAFVALDSISASKTGLRRLVSFLQNFMVHNTIDIIAIGEMADKNIRLLSEIIYRAIDSYRHELPAKK
jgi:hypothetical protein